ncbi:MG2 domain-containing protein [Winogradskyella sp.]|uniref:MG2 domain-containing protein n=1 Tax=Winogradskyella sp. TaxID=1883156 RepID=UPI003F6BE664
MKYYISLLMILCFANFSNAQDDFDSQWNAVTKYEKEGLIKSAAEVVDTIFKSAKEKEQSQQRIKALLYESKYMLVLEEEAQLNIIDLFKSEIKLTDNLVTKHILENMLANMYWQYFQQNRYQFYNRSKTAVKNSEDFRTWDLETLFNEIHVYFQRSLENGILLQQESLSKYSMLLIEAENSKTFRPTLFDLLSHNALAFYKTDENSITKPAYKFSIDQPDYFIDYDTFSNLEIETKDTTSLQLHSLKIYQNLFKAHVPDGSPYPIVSNNIERLKFIFEHSTLDNKEDLYFEALLKESEKTKSYPYSSLYDFEIASLYQKQGNRYNSSEPEEVNSNHRWKLKEAIELCNKVIEKHPESQGAKKFEVLKQQILQPNLRLQAEGFIPINSPSRILVNYKNLTKLRFKIYKISKSQLKSYNERYNAAEKTQFFKNLRITQTFESSLKSEGDFQNHSTEIILPELKNGLYLIKAETYADENVFAVAHLQVTDLALTESSEDDKVNYQLINRTNGEPIVDADINISYRNNNNRTFSKIFVTNRFGKFEFKRDKNYYRAVEIKADYKDDIAFFGDYYISRKYRERENNDTKYNVFLFTDRSIYRPRQTVYFKGIAIATKDGKTKVFTDNVAKVKLKNVNGEDVSELLLKTNEFGSVSGEFILPNDGLTGGYTIEMFCGNFGYATFSVEEYKRPKFKPEFQPIFETFKVNDSITVLGKAIAFAGSNITDAKVVYRVKRQVQFPGWYYWRRPYFNSEPQEITFGEVKTNSKGEFKITFKAIPDESVSKDNLPVFKYEITADVTDINGETRTATTIVNVGYHAMMLNIVSSDIIDTAKKKHKIELVSQNLNGESVPAIGTLKIYKLEAPENVLRNRPWNAPDYQIISKEEFKRLFPHDPYNNEHLLTNWKKGKEVFSANFNTEKDKSIILKKLKNWDSGKYIIVAESQDKFEQIVKDEKYISLFNNSDKNIADHQLFEATLDKDSYKAGDIAKLTLGSAAKDITVTVDIEKDNEIIVTQLVRLNHSKKTISIPVLENDLGGFEAHCSLAAFNSYVSQSFRVNVPYPKTDLDIETVTFRDKLQPGQDETWSFKIKGPEGDKVSAELLASMYDASLDEFRAHNWNFNPIYYPEYYGRVNKNGYGSFQNTNFRLFNRFAQISGYPSQNYDQLNWFGLYFGYGSSHIRRTLARVPGVKFEDYKDTPEEYLMISEDAVENLEVRETDSGIDYMNAGGRLNDSVYFETVGKFKTSEYLDDPDYSFLSKKAKIVSNKGKSIQIRKNLNETAFFFPQLQTDAEGNGSFNFKAPEALTKWKLQLLAHTKTLESAIMQLEAVTQKELMVITNVPPFLREGDKIRICTKIANLTEKQLSGVAQLLLTDPISGKSIDSELSNTENELRFEVNARGNIQVTWNLTIPEGIQAIQYKVIAKAGNFADGEQNALPVLSNRMLVTETLPMWVRSNQTKTFTLDKLKNTTSTTLSNHKLTLEMTSNPAWYALQALPYLMEYPYDCNEQVFARYYANTLAKHIVNSNPNIEAVFNQWKSTDALLSNLEKNQELKALLIEETPWLRDAQSETEQKKRIGLLFDLNKMSSELQSAQRKLKNNQMSSGAWSWFNGGRDNRYITQHIIAGFGHLKQLNVNQSGNKENLIQSAFRYLDQEFVKEYNNLKKYNKNIDLSKDHLSYMQLHYLYVRSFYPELKPSNDVQKIMDYYKNQIQ